MASNPPSFDDLMNAGKAEATVRRPELTIDPGDVSEFLLAGAAAMAESVLQYSNQRFKGTFLDTAEGDELTLRADDRGVQRFEPQNATGVLSFSRPTDAEGAGTLDAGTTVATERDAFGNQVEYTLDVDLSFGATDLGPLTVNATAVISGPTGDAQPNTITRITSTVFDTTLTVTNPENFAGGASEEEDPSVRERVRQLPTTIRRGTNAALEYGAKQVAGVAMATSQDNDGIVSLYIADSSGSSSPTLVTTVQREIDTNWKCAGEIVNVYGASTISTGAITITLTVRTGVDKGALTPNIKAAIVARLAKLKIGESATNAQIMQAVLNVDTDAIVDLDIAASLPTPLPNQLVRAVEGDITVA